MKKTLNALNVVLATVAAGLLALQSLPAAAQNASKLVEGRDYVRLQMPQPTEVAGKIEVIEFFWYGCPACNQLEPLIKTWVKNLPADVHFRKVPAIFRDSWAPGARLFYTIEALNRPELHEAVFRAWHTERVDLNDEKTLFDWVARQGVDRQKFIDAYKSFAVDAQVRRAAEMTREYGFGGVPTLVVAGKYSPAPKLGTWGDVLRITEELIKMSRAELRRDK